MTPLAPPVFEQYILSMSTELAKWYKEALGGLNLWLVIGAPRSECRVRTRGWTPCFRQLCWINR